jgi:DNA repair exonuclease SbcCD nuclease subunit
MKYVMVGDPHAKVSNLKDMQKLIYYSMEVGRDYGANNILFLGDLLDTHAIIRVEVLDFWHRNFKMLKSNGFNVLTLVGNHDQQSSKELEQEMNALNIFEDIGVQVFNKPTIFDDTLFVPYHGNHKRFLEICNLNSSVNNVICHQTFDGAMYDNGFYAPDGIDLTLIPQKNVLSGHVHKKSQIGKCNYPGTPKWDSANDAGEEKGIHILEISSDKMDMSELISTRHIVTPINKVIMKEGDAEIELEEAARNYMELTGSSTWIAKMKKKYKNKANIKSIYTDRLVTKSAAVKSTSLLEFVLANFKPIDGITGNDIQDYMKEVLSA